MDKNLILEAWARYRPAAGLEEEQEPQRDIKSILGNFMKKMILGVKQNSYNGDDVPNEKETSQGMHQEMQVFLNTVLDNEGYLDAEEEGYRDIENGDEAEVFKDVPEEEVQLIEDFLEKFVLINESSTSTRE
jgi:hypothetical protein